MNTIYQLGRALAKRDYHSAADFCFLVCGVLGGTNPFEPIATPLVVSFLINVEQLLFSGKARKITDATFHSLTLIFPITSLIQNVSTDSCSQIFTPQKFSTMRCD